MKELLKNLIIQEHGYISEDALIATLLCLIAGNKNLFVISNNIQQDCIALNKFVRATFLLPTAIVNISSSTTPKELFNGIFCLPSGLPVNTETERTDGQTEKFSRSSSQSQLGESIDSLPFPPQTAPENQGRFPARPSLSYSGTIPFYPTPSRQIPNLVFIQNLDDANEILQSAILEMLVHRQISEKNIAYNFPSPFVIIALAKPSNRMYRLSSHLMDKFFLNSMMAKEHLIDCSENKRFDDQESNRNGVITDNDLRQLHAKVNEVSIHPHVQLYMRDILLMLRNHEHVHIGPSPKSTTDYLLAAKLLAVIGGINFVSPTIVSAVAAKVLGHRLIIKGDFLSPTCIYPNKHYRDAYDAMRFAEEGLPFHKIVKDVVGDEVWGGGRVKPPM